MSLGNFIKMRIRKAGGHDVEAVAQILCEAARWLERSGIPMWRDDELSPDRIASDVESGLFFIAEVDTEPAGVVKFQLEDGQFWPDVPAGESAFVHRLAVRRRFAGGQVSSALLTWAVGRAGSLGKRYLRLDCEASRAKLRAFYERLGFVHHSDRQVGPYFVARYEYCIDRDPESRMSFSFDPAVPTDAPILAALHTAAAEDLTRRYGQGPWSMKTSEKGVLQAMRTSQVFVARQGRELAGTLRLTTTKPWAIDINYFSPCRRPLYLLSMAIVPQWQRAGLGRRCLEEAKRVARNWLADALRLDAYDADAGAGPFYSRCGFREVGRNTYRGVPLIYFESLLTPD